MALSKQLLDILACPDDKSPVKLNKKGTKQTLVCPKCKRVFPIENDIPIMLPKEGI